MRFSTIFSNFKIKTKLLALAVASSLFLAVFFGISFYNDMKESENALQLIETNTRSAYDIQIKNQVQSAVTLLNEVYQKHLSGEMTLEQSKLLGADLIRSMRYGNNSYFWVDTTEGVNVVLLGSKTEGTNRYDFRDIKGTLVVQAFIRNATEGTDACIDYWFPKEGEMQAVHKRGYSKLFQPFGWVVGTGIYMDEIDSKIALTKQNLENALKTKVAVFAVIFSIFIGLSFAAISLISKNISKPLQKAVAFAARLSNGMMDAEIHEDIKTRKDEVGKLSVSLEKMKNAIGTLVDNLTEKADALSREKELLRTTLISVGDGVISTDESGNIVLINPVAELLTGWTKNDAAGKHLEDVFRIVSDGSADPVKNLFQDGKIAVLESDTFLISKTGKCIPVESTAAPISDKSGAVRGAVLVFHDVTERKKKMEQIRYLGYHDQLTGLYNRAYFEQQMAKADIPESSPISLIMADVNGLKLTNDAFGHSAGDKLIYNTAQALKNSCRSDDFIFRIGGDEFVIILPRTHLQQAKALVKRIRNTIRDAQKDDSTYLSVSFGCAEKTLFTPTMEDVLRQAEDSMYREKLVESKSTKILIIENIKTQLFSTMKEDNESYIDISRVCSEIGKAMNFDPRDLHDLSTAALLYDIGKVTLNRKILTKETALTEEEWMEVKHHAEAGYHILKSLNEMSQVAEYVLAHHELWNGTGYPKGLKGAEIPLPSRIITVVDSYFAMINDRPYRKAYPQEKAVDEITKNAGILFDPEVVRVFLRVCCPESAAQSCK